MGSAYVDEWQAALFSPEQIGDFKIEMAPFDQSAISHSAKGSQKFNQRIEKRALHISNVQDRFRHYRAIKCGYAGLGQITLFIIAYCWVLGMQHRTSAVCGANASLQIFFEKFKTDLKVSNAATFYGYLTKKVVPAMLQGSWTSTTRAGKDISGRTAQDYFHVMGGLVLTSVKGSSHHCFRGNECYYTSPPDVPYHNLSLKGEASFPVPATDQANGHYSVSVPSSTSDENQQALLAAYKGLFGPDTREIWLRAVAFNPSGMKTVTSMALGIKISVYNDIRVFTRIQTIPYHQYQPGDMIWQIAMEVTLLLGGLLIFWRPLIMYQFYEPKLTSDNEADRCKWFAWKRTWMNLPLRGGRPNVKTPSLLITCVALSVCVWLYLSSLYAQLEGFGQKSLDWLFVDPLTTAGSSLSSKMALSLDAANRDVFPFMELIDQISLTYSCYFYVHVVVTGLFVMRVSQFLSFQKRLSTVADTFSDVFDDMLHMGAVFMVVCFLFGVINSLAFGAYDPAFQTFAKSFAEMVLVCFGMFKPSAGIPYVASLFKYTPHTVIDTEFASWVPIVLQIAFKTIVILLLFKLLMGVIMDGYKKHAKFKSKFPTVRQDITELSIQLYHRACAKLLGRPFVPIFHVALAVGRATPDPDRPWEKFFLGLDDPEEVKRALNNVFSLDMPPVIRDEVRRKQLKEVGDAEVEFVLRVYGTGRRKAELHFAQLSLAVEQKKLLKKDVKESVAKQEVGTKEEEIAADLVEAQLESLRHYRRERKSCSRDGSDASSPLEKVKLMGPSNQDLKEIFQEYDFLNLGVIEHHFMPQLFRQLGYEISGYDLANVLIEWDLNEDACCSFKEFRELVHDERLIGVWRSRDNRIAKDVEGKQNLPPKLFSMRVSTPKTPLLDGGAHASA